MLFFVVTAPDILRQLKVTLLDNEDCLDVMGEYFFKPEEELCVGSLDGLTGACYVRSDI